MKYTLNMGEGGAAESIEIDADDLDHARYLAGVETENWISDGDWGIDGASVDGWWTIKDEEGDTIASGYVTVEIEPDHEALMDAAGADPDCDHEWTSEGEGGCESNPGVWATGGTSMMFRSHCIHCGLIKIEHTTGWQRNPGEHDTVEYRLPDQD